MTQSFTLGQELKAFRKSRGMTQIQAGELIGFSNRYVSQIENGGAIPLRTAEIIKDKIKALKGSAEPSDSSNDPQEIRLAISVSFNEGSSEWNFVIKQSDKAKTELEKVLDGFMANFKAYLQVLAEKEEDCFRMDASCNFSTTEIKMHSTSVRSKLDIILSSFRDFVLSAL